MGNIISYLEAANKFYEQRHLKIAENIKESDTPGAKGKDLEMDFSKLVHSEGKLSMATTNSGHIGLGNNNGFKPKVVISKAESSLNGNNIDLTDEMLKSTENAKDAEIAKDLYKKWFALIKASIGSN